MAKGKQKKTDKKSFPIPESFPRKNLFHVAVFCFSLLLYLNTIPNDYNLDDELVTKNHKLTSQGIKAIPEIFTSPYYSDNMGYAFEYRPMVHVSFALEHQFFGESPHVSHFFNALLYACMCTLLFSVLQVLFKNITVYFALLVALLFAAHPVHTEVVASIKNRDEMLAMFFSLASWYVLLKYSGKNLWVSLAGGSLLFFLALLSKLSVFSYVLLVPFSILVFQRLPFTRILLVTISLFIPAFFVISVLSIKLKFLLLAGFLVMLYISYFLIAIVNHFRTRANLSSVLRFDWKEFLMKEVFPFNHPYFFPVLYLLPVIGSIAGFFVFIGSSNHALLAISCGLCLILSFHAPAVFKWVLLFVFQGALLLMNHFVNELFGIVIASYWCFLAWIFLESQERKGRVFYGSLLALNFMPSLFVRLTPWGDYLGPIIFSIAVFLILPHGKFRNFGGVFIILFQFLLAAENLFKHKIFTPSAIFFTVYILAVYYPGKFKIKQQWFFSGVVTTFICLALLLRGNYYEGLRVKTVSSIVSKNAVTQSGEADSQITGNNTLPQSKFTNQQTGRLSLTILPGRVINSVNRPLDFAENPVTFQDPLPARVASSFDILLRYLRLIVIPYPLSYYYGYKIIQPRELSDSIVVLSIAVYALLSILAFFFFIRNLFVPFFGIIFYLATILQFTNVFQAVPGMMGDRYLLSPSFGFCILLVYTLFKLLRLENVSAYEQLNRISKSVILALLLIYSMLTVARNQDWKNHLTLFKNDIKHIDASAQGHNLLGVNLLIKAEGLNDDKVLQKQLREEAAIHLKRALEIYPGFFNAAYDLGRTYTRLGVNDSALKYFEKAEILDTTFSEINVNMGEIYFFNGKYGEATKQFEKAIQKRPDYYQGYDKLSYVYFVMKEFNKAIEVNKLAMTRMPKAIDPFINLGRTYMGINERDSAKIYFQKALAINPGNPEIERLLRQEEGHP